MEFLSTIISFVPCIFLLVISVMMLYVDHLWTKHLKNQNEKHKVFEHWCKEKYGVTPAEFSTVANYEFEKEITESEKSECNT